jgi:hypothetical protein
MMAELAPLINVPAYVFGGNSIFTAHVTAAFLGSLYPALIVGVLLMWGFPASVAWIGGGLLALSPWHILFSRTSFEQPTSLFFYTFSWLLLDRIYRAKSRQSTFLAFGGFALSFILGFFTYHGYKFSLPLLTGVLILLHPLTLKHRARSLFAGLIIVGCYGWILLHYDVYRARQGEVSVYAPSLLAQEVANSRRSNVLPARLQSVLDNKLTVALTHVGDKLATMASPHILYRAGENNLTFATGATGYLAVVLIPFVFIGLATLLLDLRVRTHLVLLALMACGAIPTLLHANNSFAFRAASFLVGLTLVAAVGISRAEGAWGKRTLRGIVALGLMLSMVHFLYVYFGSYPVIGARAHFFADRVLATYLSHRRDEKILVLDPQPRYIVSEMILAQKQITRTDLEPLLGHFSTDENENVYQIGGVTIRRGCPPPEAIYDTVIVDYVLEGSLTKCGALAGVSHDSDRAIVDPVDSGATKRIYGDSICPESTRPYVHATALADFALDSMSRVQFCENWIVKP